MALAAAVIGGAGLGLEVLLLSCLGLAAGSSSAASFGLASWISGWALGAGFAGTRVAGDRSPPWRTLAAVSVVMAPLSLGALLFLGLWAGPGAGPMAMAVVALAAFPQGCFLPWLAGRSRGARASRRIALLVVANLVGSVAGAFLIGSWLPGGFGRFPSACAAGILAYVGAMLAKGCEPAQAATPPASKTPSEPTPGLRRPVDPRAAGLWLGLSTATLLVTEWFALRLGGLWLGGMQPALAALLSASLISLAVGSLLLPAVLPRTFRALPLLWAGIALGALWPAFAAPFLAAQASDLGRALVLVGPLLLAYGALVPCLSRLFPAEVGAGRRLSGLFIHEAWGAWLGAPLAHLVLVQHLGTAGTLGASVAVLGVASALLFRGQPWLGRALGGATLVGAGGFLLWSEPPALQSPQLDNAALQRLGFEEDAHFAVSVVNDGVRAERTLLTDEFRATGTGDDYLYMRVLGHLPLLLHPDPKRVGVLAFGTGTTAGAVSLHPEVERIDVFELSRAVARAAPHFREVNHDVFAEGLPGLLDENDGEARTVLHLGDGRHRLRGVPGALDVLTMEPLLPDSPFAVYLYTREFYLTAQRALRPGGLLCQWVPPHALEPATFEAVVGAFTSAFPWSGVFLFGSQVILVGGEACPELRRERFPSASEALFAHLEPLGLQSPGGLAARWILDGTAWPVPERELTDADPWVIYARRERGTQVLGDLPRNLKILRERRGAIPERWSGSLTPEEELRRSGVAWVHRTREAFEAQRARTLGWRADAEEVWDSSVDAGLEEVFRWLPEDAEALLLSRWVRFDRARTAGVTALRAGEWGAALDSLTQAAQLRPERGDVHLFVAVAAIGLQEEALALRAKKRALELCPRLLETPQGQVALALDPSGQLAAR